MEQCECGRVAVLGQECGGAEEPCNRWWYRRLEMATSTLGSSLIYLLPQSETIAEAKAEAEAIYRDMLMIEARKAFLIMVSAPRRLAWESEVCAVEECDSPKGYGTVHGETPNGGQECRQESSQEGCPTVRSVGGQTGGIYGGGSWRSTYQ